MYGHAVKDTYLDMVMWCSDVAGALTSRQTAHIARRNRVLNERKVELCMKLTFHSRLIPIMHQCHGALHTDPCQAFMVPELRGAPCRVLCSRHIHKSGGVQGEIGPESQLQIKEKDTWGQGAHFPL